jgi:hypothetical protein
VQVDGRKVVFGGQHAAARSVGGGGRAWCAASCRERERELDADGDAHADLLDQIQRRDGSPRAAPPGVRVYVLVAFFLPNNVVIARSSVFVRPFLRVIIMSGGEYRILYVRNIFGHISQQM